MKYDPSVKMKKQCCSNLALKGLKTGAHLNWPLASHVAAFLHRISSTATKLKLCVSLCSCSHCFPHKHPHPKPFVKLLCQTQLHAMTVSHINTLTQNHSSNFCARHCFMLSPFPTQAPSPKTTRHPWLQGPLAQPPPLTMHGSSTLRISPQAATAIRVAANKRLACW